MSDELTKGLSRWSQRKLAARRGEPVEEPREDEPRRDEAVTADASAGEPIAANGAAEEEMPVLPPIEELTAESDYTVFLAEKVPEALRRVALRKLWRSDPVFANRDGLNDYDEDYHAVDTAITRAQTTYQTGRGHLDAFQERLESLEPAEERKLTEEGEPTTPAELPSAEKKGVAPVDDPDTASRQADACDEAAGAAEPLPHKSF